LQPAIHDPIVPFEPIALFETITPAAAITLEVTTLELQVTEEVTIPVGKPFQEIEAQTAKVQRPLTEASEMTEITRASQQEIRYIPETATTRK
jgi:hypothetical protein